MLPYLTLLVKTVLCLANNQFKHTGVWTGITMLYKYRKVVREMTDSIIQLSRKSLYVLLLMMAVFILTSSADGFEKKENARQLYVCNSGNDNVTIYNAEANGDQAPLRSFGDVTALVNPYDVSIDTRTNEIYVINDVTADHFNKIAIYGINDQGNSPPKRTIYAENPCRDNSADCIHNAHTIAIDETRNEIYLLDQSVSSIGVFPLSAKENNKPSRIIGNIGWHISPDKITFDGKNNEFFIVGTRADKGRICVYDGPIVNVEGDFNPKRIIAGPSTGLKDPSDLAVDPVNNEIIVANGTDDSIIVYKRTADENAIPIRTITGNNTSLSWPRRIVVDPVRNEIYVANWGKKQSITVYERTSQGNVKPLRTIAGENTGLKVPSIALNKNNGELTVANYYNNSIVIFKHGATGNAEPIRTIAGSRKGRNGIRGIAVDREQKEIYISNRSNNSISVYKMNARGNNPPVRTITGPLTELSEPSSITLDVNNKELFVTNYKNNSITVHRMRAEGNIAPLRKIAGMETGLNIPIGITINPQQKEIYVTNLGAGQQDNSITVYNSDSKGNISPLRIIAGKDTELNSPNGIVLDVNRNELFVANYNGKSVTVYDSKANGNTKPLRSISGAIAGLVFPSEVALDTVQNELFVSDYNSIKVYKSIPDGKHLYSRPIQIIEGKSTKLSAPVGLAVTNEND
jgi:DNA-binding beta-propeller fold protein YncE